MNLLTLDSSSSLLQVQVRTLTGTVLSYRYQQMKGVSNGHLAEAVVFLLHQAGLTASEIDLLITASGPGSFTGLRVGMALVKGLVAATAKPFVLVNVLDALAQKVEGEVLSVIDGKKGRLYAALYQAGTRVTPYWDLSPEDLMTRLKQIGRASVQVTGNYAFSLAQRFSEFLTATSDPESTMAGLEKLGLAQWNEKGSAPLGASLFYLRESDAAEHLRGRSSS